MSLESSIADLVAIGGDNLKLPQQISEYAKAQIKAVSDAYQENIARADISRYVDKANGDDVNNSGRTSGSPYKTIQRAINDAVPGGLITVVIAGDYHLDEHVNILNRKVRITPPSGAAQKPVFTFAPYADIPTGTRCLKRFCLAGDATINLNTVKLKMPDTTGFAALQADYRSCMVGPPDGVSDSIYTRMAVGIGQCDIDIPAANFGQVVSGPMYQLYAAYVTATNQPLLGRWLDRYTDTAGTPSVNIPNVFTNLAKI